MIKSIILNVDLESGDDSMITSEIIEEFKERMHIDGDEDAYLARILIASEQALKDVCGDYNIELDDDFKELVFERSRYVYNDALEYFEKNFLTRINTLSMKKALEEVQGDDDAAI